MTSPPGPIMDRAGFVASEADHDRRANANVRQLPTRGNALVLRLRGWVVERRSDSPISHLTPAIYFGGGSDSSTTSIRSC